MTVPVLWHFPISHYNEKVRWALDYKHIPHIRRALFLDYLPKALWKTGQPTLPVIIWDGCAMADSTRIISEIERRYPAPPLYPLDDAERRRALELEDYFDEQVGHGLRAALIGPILKTDPDTAVETLGLGQKRSILRLARLGFLVLRAVYQRRHRITDATIEAGRCQVLAALDRIERELQPSGYLVGARFSVADLTAASLLYPLALPAEYPYPIPSGMRKHSRAFRESVDNHTACSWVRDIYRRHRGASAEINQGRKFF